MGRELKVLFIPFEGVGHINGCISLAQELVRSQHKVIFAVNDQWTAFVEDYGFETALLNAWMHKNGNFWDGHANRKSENEQTPLEKTLNRVNHSNKRVDYYIELDSVVEQLLKDIRPDVIVIEQFQSIPSVEVSGIPWVFNCTSNPLFFYGMDDDVPPRASGLPMVGDKDVLRAQWKQHKDNVIEAHYEPWKRYNEFMVSRGVNPLRRGLSFNGSPYLNVYGFPRELDYSEQPLPENYVGFDHLMRQEVNTPFEIPDQLKGKSGKLIYFSLGSMHSAKVEIMKRLVTILSKSEHRFIVSKGPRHDEFELADNMWGEKSVPQIKVLPSVDLVITHGGNNTVCETFYFGKPMVVLPHGSDQLDNAQRIQELGYGLRLDLNNCTEEELLGGIETLLNDKQLNEKLKNISKRIQTENNISKFPKLIEDLAYSKAN